MLRIAEQRERAGKTQAQLAEAMGVTPAAVAHWERGRRVPSIAVLQRIADALGCKLVKLIE
jgi:transcriptional regulator with XRE-family HTH domain